jgi:arylsulfatase A-like enzyme/Tfp pilus assembly protein PilF
VAALIGGLVLLTMIVAFVATRYSASAGPARRLNVLLVTLDTTRADHIGCYGSRRARTPLIDRLAAEGTRFETAISPVPITAAAHTSILTGLYPFEHGVRNNGDFYLADRFDTLAMVLHKAGYRTAAFVSSFVLDRRYGLARGFDAYDDRQDGEDTEGQVINLEAERRGDRTAAALSAWLDLYARNPSAPFFAWLHLYDPHTPYAPPPPYQDAFADAPYDGEIAFDDGLLASLVDKLGRLGLRENTLLVIVGDHGESLGEHGEETHGMFVYESALHVPFVIWRPGLVPVGVVRGPVRLIDVAPTILELLGAPALATKSARSLVAVMKGGKDAPPPVYAETLFPELNMNWAPLRSVRDERWKLIDAPTPELYDLQNDPGERENRYTQQPQTARALTDLLAHLTGGGQGEMSRQALDKSTIDRLASLGYIGAGGGTDSRGASAKARPDPKDLILVYNQLNQANRAVMARRFDEALPVLRAVLARDPSNAYAHQVLGNVYFSRGEDAKALGEYRALATLVPTNAYAHHWIALCYLRLGQPDKALAETDAALALDPKDCDTRVLRASILASRGAVDAAVAELRAAIATDPVKGKIRLDLAKLLVEAGRLAEARHEYEAALAERADYAPALADLGALDAKEGRLEEAVTTLARALALDPSDYGARINLARVYERLGRPADAVAEYQRLRDDARVPADYREAAGERLRELARGR